MALGKTKQQLLREISSNELSEWIAFDRAFNLADPFYMTSTLGVAITRSLGSAKLNLEDFAPIYKQPRRRPTAEEVLAIFSGIARNSVRNRNSVRKKRV